MIVEAVRLLITLGLTALGFETGRSLAMRVPDLGASQEVGSVMGALLGAAVGYVAGGVTGRRIRRGLDAAPRRVAPDWSGPELFAGAFGAMVGVVVGVAAAIPVVVFLPAAVGWSLAGLLVLLTGAFGGRVFAARAEELLVVAGLRPRRPLTARTLDGGPSSSYLVDSSAAIDGRILELARSGLVRGRAWVPAFVVDELQGIADAAERGRRRRGRRGLDVLEALRDVPGVEVVVLEELVPEHPEVDAKLVALAERAGATLVTTDSNLARAAGVRGIAVLNPRELGESLRPAVMAGERMWVVLSKAGTEPGQGVGYLEDGTMVVVEQGAELVGEEVEVEVTGSLRTSVGRMIFARRAG